MMTDLPYELVRGIQDYALSIWLALFPTALISLALGFVLTHNIIGLYLAGAGMLISIPLIINKIHKENGLVETLSKRCTDCKEEASK